MVLAVVVCLIGSAPAFGGVIVGFDPNNPVSVATYDRFTSGFPNNPVPNTSPLFTGAGLDLSGAGWRVNGNWGVTLVSPQQFVTAAHTGLFSPGEQVRFLGADGVVHSYAVATDPNTGAVIQTRLTTTFTDPTTGAPRTLPSDLLVVTLANPVPAADRVHPLAVGSGIAPPGTGLLVYGQNPDYGTDTRQLGRNTLDAIDLASFDNLATEATVVSLYDFTRTLTGDTALIGGDSGSPLLTRFGDTAVVLGTHYGVEGDLNDPNSTYLSASAYLPYYLGQLQAVVGASGQSLQVVPLAVPEPATVALFAGCCALGICLRRRRG
jgi:hypothetical protein